MIEDTAAVPFTEEYFFSGLIFDHRVVTLTSTTNLVDHYIVYHNPDSMGYGVEEVTDFSIVTSKTVLPAKSHRVWLVTGRGTPRRYSLVFTFIANEVVPALRRDELNGLRGVNGTRFKPEIPLNNLKWFPEFKRANGNFGFGFQRLRDPALISELERLLVEAETPKSGSVRRRASAKMRD